MRTDRISKTSTTTSPEPANDPPAGGQPSPKPAAPDGGRRRKLGVRFG